MSQSQKQTVTENIEMIRLQVILLFLKIENVDYLELSRTCLEIENIILDIFWMTISSQRENKVRGAEVQSLKAQVVFQFTSLHIKLSV